jgi:methionyl-tRNA synthetase
LPIEQRFSKIIDLRIAKIVKIERHPKADKLYIETLDDGSGIERVIVSGLVPFYKEEELLGKSIVLVNNLKPAKLRGVESKGMLLAASRSGPEGKEAVEVLAAPWAAPGSKVVAARANPTGSEGNTAFGTMSVEPDGSTSAPLSEINVDDFFSVPIHSREGFAVVGDFRLEVEGQPILLEKVRDGEVG